MISQKWWKDATVYQIWPNSYKDSNGDGIGDILGIISTLDYIKSLGADVIWLSPHYDSPQEDMGYDISNYESVHPKYGTMEDMDELIKQVHERGMKIILDLVVNHTSSEHAWFKESRSSKTNPKRGWYIWKPPQYDENGNRKPPNNWASKFSGSAWEFDELTGEYYLRLYAKSQPDLNWENEKCKHAIYKSALTFWLEKGIDGFRIDVARLYSKIQTFPDAPVVSPEEEFQPCEIVVAHGPRIHEFLKEMNRKVISKYDAMTVGEVNTCSRETALKYISAKENELNMMFLFDVVDVGTKNGNLFKYEGFQLTDFKAAIKRQYDLIENSDAWATVFIENHDSPRSVSRFGNTQPEFLFKSAKLLALLQTTLSGTLYIYQGQEIAMTNLPSSWSISEYLDVNTISNYNNLRRDCGDDKKVMGKFMEAVKIMARDHARSPFQWNTTKNAGFSVGNPWTRVNNNYKDINVANQVNDPNSILSFWKKSLFLRKKYKDLFIYGSLKILDYDNQEVFTYMKEMGNQKAYVVLNFSTKQVSFEKLIHDDVIMIHSNVDVVEHVLTPYEGRVYITK